MAQLRHRSQRTPAIPVRSRSIRARWRVGLAVAPTLRFVPTFGLDSTSASTRRFEAERSDVRPPRQSIDSQSNPKARSSTPTWSKPRRASSPSTGCCRSLPPREMRAALDRLGKPLVAALLTHSHPDHYAGLGEIVAGYDVPILRTARGDRHDHRRRRTQGTDHRADVRGRLAGQARLSEHRQSATARASRSTTSASPSSTSARASRRTTARGSSAMTKRRGLSRRPDLRPPPLLPRRRLLRRVAGEHRDAPRALPRGRRLLHRPRWPGRPPRMWDWQRGYIEPVRRCRLRTPTGPSPSRRRPRWSGRMKEYEPSEELQFLMELSIEPVAATRELLHLEGRASARGRRLVGRGHGPGPAPVGAGRREWIGLAVIALPCLLYSMDLTVLNLAVPSLSADLEPSSSQLLWIVDIYGFMVAGLLITMGTLGDRIGRRRLLLIGAAAFGVASVLAALLDERRDADRDARAARRRRGDAGAVDAVADPQHVPRPAQRTVAIGIWITSYLGRRRRSARWSAGCCSSTSGGARCSCSACRSWCCCSCSGRAAAGVPRSRRGPARPAQRGAVAGRRAGGDLRPQAIAAGRLGWTAGARRSSVRRARRRRVRAPAATARRPADRPAPVPRARLQRCAGRLHARLLRAFGASSSSPSTCSWCSGSSPSRRACGRCRSRCRVHRRLDADAAARARDSGPAFVIAAGLALAAVGFVLLTQVDAERARPGRDGPVVFASASPRSSRWPPT